MQVAVSSLGTDLDAWTGVPFGACPQFLVVDTETMVFVVVSVPVEQQDPAKVSLSAIRAIARQGGEVVITGPIKDICKQTMHSLGMQVIDNVGRMTVREAVQCYVQGGPEQVLHFMPLPEKIAVASHGHNLDACTSAKDEPCTSFLLVNPQTMQFELVQVEPAASLEETSIHAVRAASRAGATVVITSAMRPQCCAALRALAVSVVLAPEGMVVREAVEKYLRGELPSAPNL
jgi:predicted Fe-Mo cluster-binding NifX family protein